MRTAEMRLIIDPDPSRRRRNGSDVLFRARDEAGKEVTVALDASAWRTLRADMGAAALEELEQIALSGSWEAYGAGRLWRVTLI